MKVRSLLHYSILFLVTLSLAVGCVNPAIYSIFHDYRDELMDLLRRHGQEAVAAAA